MVITPRFTNLDNDRFGYDIPLTKNMDNIEVGMRRNLLHTIFRDAEHKTELRYKLNRDRLEFEIEIRVGTLKQQLDIFKSLQNQLVWDRPYTSDISLESMIPRAMIEYIGKIGGIDITLRDTNNIPTITRFLNAHSRYHFVQSVQPARVSVHGPYNQHEIPVGLIAHGDVKAFLLVSRVHKHSILKLPYVILNKNKISVDSLS